MMRIAPPVRSMVVVALVALAVLHVFAASVLAQSAPPSVRVRLLRGHAPQAVVLQASEGATVYTRRGDHPIGHLQQQEPLQVAAQKGQLNVAFQDLALFAEALVIEQPAGGDLSVEVVEGGTKVTRRYRGTLILSLDEAASSTLKVLNDIPLEDYVASVLSREYSYDELETAKAIAVSIRTNALRSLRQRGAAYEHTDTDGWQVYDGVGPLTPTAVEATRQTRGQVLVHDDQLIEAVFFASSGGHTADNEAVWVDSAPRPYLRGRADPFDTDTPHDTWTFEVAARDLHSALSKAFGMDVRGVEVADVSNDGRAHSLRLKGPGRREQVVSGNNFRLAVNRRFGKQSLRSTLFTFNPSGSTYRFDGKGFGHGVGMSQWGAHHQARQGMGYEEILAFYYKDVALRDAATGTETLIAAGDLPAEAEPTVERASPMPVSSEDTFPVTLANVEEPSTPPADARAGTQTGPEVPTKRPRPRPKKRIGW